MLSSLSGRGNSRHSSEAFRLLNSVLPTYPKDAEVLTRLAYLYQERGEPDRARPLYEAAINEDSHQMVAVVNLGAIYAWDNQIDRAIKLWGEALNYDPGFECCRSRPLRWFSVRRETGASTLDPAKGTALQSGPRRCQTVIARSE